MMIPRLAAAGPRPGRADPEPPRIAPVRRHSPRADRSGDDAWSGAASAPSGAAADVAAGARPAPPNALRGVGVQGRLGALNERLTAELALAVVPTSPRLRSEYHGTGDLFGVLDDGVIRGHASRKTDWCRQVFFAMGEDRLGVAADFARARNATRQAAQESMAGVLGFDHDPSLNYMPPHWYEEGEVTVVGNRPVLHGSGAVGGLRELCLFSFDDALRLLRWLNERAPALLARLADARAPVCLRVLADVYDRTADVCFRLRPVAGLASYGA